MNAVKHRQTGPRHATCPTRQVWRAAGQVLAALVVAALAVALAALADGYAVLALVQGN